MAGKFYAENESSTQESTSKSDKNADLNNAQNRLVNGASASSPTPSSHLQNHNESSKDKDTGSEEASSRPVGEKHDCKTGTPSEVVLIQDTGFTVHVSVPGVETFDLQVSSMELVQEIHQVLMDREDTCHRTCFSVQLDGNTLDNFAELKSIEGLKEGSLLRVVEEPYTAREARIHVRHVRDLLKSLDNSDAYSGVDCMSLSFLNTVTNGDILEKKKSRRESVDCTPPDYIIPDCKERPLMPLHPISKDQRAPQCLKVLTVSGWNPPPGPRKMHGDLLYLYVITLEDKRYHITASTKGFYVNQTTEDVFNPKAAQQKHLSHSLIDLLCQISPAFKRNFAILQKKRVQRHPFERVATPYQLYSWVAPTLEHTIDSIRAEDAFSSKLGYEEHIPGQTRDWNEELQTTRELSQKNLPERLLRERAIFKVHSDFVSAATRGAMAVIDGNVMAINPGEDAKMQLFIWNNIFFSLGFDVKDHYKALGGDAAAYAAPGNDLQGVKAYWGVDLEGLYTLGTVVIDYRGYRVTAQSIIPGILEREQEQSVVYGSIDFGKTVVGNNKYVELLSGTAKHLKIKPHKVLNEKDEVVELCSSIECKGIVGNDGRHYILDLLRTFPPDVNFLPVEGLEFSESMKNFGFPREHKHKLCCLRQELVDAFVEARYLLFIKHAAFHLQILRSRRRHQVLSEGSPFFDDKQTKEETKTAEEKVNDSETHRESSPEPSSVHDATCSKHSTEHVNGVKSDESMLTELSDSHQVHSDVADDMEADEAKKIVEAAVDSDKIEDSTKEIVKKAAQAVSSLKDTEFDIRFNPDVFSCGVRFPDSEKESLEKEKNLVKEAAEFLVMNQVGLLIRHCLEHTSSPIDGYTLTEAMQLRGVNMRYLGHVAKILAKMPKLDYLHAIVVSEVIIRSTKHLFKTYMQGVDQMSLAAAVSHFLNCFLGSFPTPHASITSEELQSKHMRKKNKKRNKQKTVTSNDNTEWVTCTPKSLWLQIAAEMQSYYNYTMDSESVDGAVEKYALQKVSLLRSFCSKCGVQVLLRDYNFDTKQKQTFGEDDVVNFFPVVKHVNPKATDAHSFFSTGQNKIQQGFLKEGYELISEALNLLNNVYGAMHPEIATCLRLLARLNYIMGDYAEAMAQQQKAVLMSERVMGIDHPNTVTEYTHLALYCFANSHISTALKLLYRARYLVLLIHGENHPELSLLDSNIGLILHAVNEHELALRFLDKALALSVKYHSNRSMKVAINYHLKARVQSCQGDFRGALQSEKETFTVYRNLLGEEHEKTKESSECLKHLTQQAVVLQKKMNEIYKGNATDDFPPLQIQAPSMASILDMLNVINGILFVQISQKDIEVFRREFELHQAEGITLTKACGLGVELADSDKVSDGNNNGVGASGASQKSDETSPVQDTIRTAPSEMQIDSVSDDASDKMDEAAENDVETASR